MAEAGHILPAPEHVSSLICFLRAWHGETPILIHCFAGISRSMAAALIAPSLKSSRCEAKVAEHLRQAAPHAQPNRQMVALADRLLGCDGRLFAALDAIEPAEWVSYGPLTRLSLLPECSLSAEP